MIAILDLVKPEIIFLCETKLKARALIEYEGYVWPGFNRRNQLKTAKCGSGGIGIFIKKCILNEWSFEEIDSTVDGLYLTCLVNKLTDFTIMMTACYLPPENSNWGSDSDTFYNHFTSQLYTHESSVEANGRIGNSNDFILDVDEIIPRKSIDDVIKKHGEALLEFLMGNKLCVLNGRVPGNDNFTYIRPQGKSVVDYFFTQMDSMQYFKHMYVIPVSNLFIDKSMAPTCAVPDH